MSSQARLDEEWGWDETETDETVLDRAGEGAMYSQPGETGDRPDAPRDTTKCQGCGTPISERRRRQLGDNDDTVWHCLDCPGICKADLANGAGARPEYPVGQETAVGDFETSQLAREGQVPTARGGRR